MHMYIDIYSLNFIYFIQGQFLFIHVSIYAYIIYSEYVSDTTCWYLSSYLIYYYWKQNLACRDYQPWVDVRFHVSTL